METGRHSGIPASEWQFKAPNSKGEQKPLQSPAEFLDTLSTDLNAIWGVKNLFSEIGKVWKLQEQLNELREKLIDMAEKGGQLPLQVSRSYEDVCDGAKRLAEDMPAEERHRLQMQFEQNLSDLLEQVSEDDPYLER